MTGTKIDHPFHVGQEVVLFEQRYKIRGEYPPRPTAIVTKVGRTLVHIEERHNRTAKFYLTDGREADGYGHRHIKTHEQVAAQERRERVESALKAHGITFDPYYRKEHPVEVLEDILAVLDNAASAPEPEADPDVQDLDKPPYHDDEFDLSTTR